MNSTLWYTGHEKAMNDPFTDETSQRRSFFVFLDGDLFILQPKDPKMFNWEYFNNIISSAAYKRGNINVICGNKALDHEQ